MRRNDTKHNGTKHNNKSRSSECRNWAYYAEKVITMRVFIPSAIIMSVAEPILLSVRHS